MHTGCKSSESLRGTLVKMDADLLKSDEILRGTPCTCGVGRAAYFQKCCFGHVLDTKRNWPQRSVRLSKNTFGHVLDTERILLQRCSRNLIFGHVMDTFWPRGKIFLDTLFWTRFGHGAQLAAEAHKSVQKYVLDTFWTRNAFYRRGAQQCPKGVQKVLDTYSRGAFYCR